MLRAALRSSALARGRVLALTHTPAHTLSLTHTPPHAVASQHTPATARHASTRVSRRLGPRELSLETGRLGPLTDGVVFAQWGDTSLLLSCVCEWELAPADFLPLQVDYREKAFAGGVIPSTYSRREANTSDRETLAARVIDRSVRPLFPKGFFYNSQIICSVLSVDRDADPAPLSITAASAALLTSNIPWNGPAAAVRVGFAHGAPVIAPGYDQEAQSALSLLYAGTEDRVLMMEGGASELPERDMVLSMRAAADALQPLLDMQRELAAAAGKPKKPLVLAVPPKEVMDAVRELIWDDARAMYSSHSFKKAERGNAQRLLFIKIKEQLRDRFPPEMHRYFGAAGDAVMKAALRSLVFEAAERDGVPPSMHVDPLIGPRQAGLPHDLQHLRKGDAELVERQVAASEVAGADVTAVDVTASGSSSESESDSDTELAATAPTTTAPAALTPASDTSSSHHSHPPFVPKFELLDAKGCRPDGRSTTDIRALRGEVDVLPLVHGSAIFTRGDTQVLCTTTLGALDLAQTLRPASLGGQVLKKNFFLHYDFPPYCTNEVGKVGGVNRRMIGHGALAERALVAVMPSEEAFPYTVRVTSEVSGSDGSSSMATVCGATLALLDAGVPLKAPVAGISVGTFCPPAAAAPAGSKYTLLTDIFGLEDHSGDMDFKVAGSRYGITALQLDIKPAGLPLEVLEQALWRARDARLQVLDVMAAVMPRHRDEVKASAPRVEQLVVPTEMFGKLVGPGGANVKRIQTATGARVQLDAESPVVSVYASKDNLIVAKNMITSSLDEHRRMTGNPLSLVSSPLAPTLEVGSRITAVVSKVHEFGVVLSTPDGAHELGWMHISEFTPKRTTRANDVLSEGDEVTVMVVDVDARGRGKLSIRSLLQSGEDYANYVKRKSAPLTASQAQPSASTTELKSSAVAGGPQSMDQQQVEAVAAADAPAPLMPAAPSVPTDAPAPPVLSEARPLPEENAPSVKPDVPAVTSFVDDPADILGLHAYTAAMYAYLRPSAVAARDTHVASGLPVFAEHHRARQTHHATPLRHPPPFRGREGYAPGNRNRNAERHDGQQHRSHSHSHPHRANQPTRHHRHQHQNSHGAREGGWDRPKRHASAHVTGAARAHAA